jgi:hypothetical protein
MSNFFELSDSKKKNLSFSELSNYAQRFNIEVVKTSEKTGKKINKKKEELVTDLNAVYLKNKIQEKKKNEKKIIKSSKLMKNDIKMPKIIGYYQDEQKLFNGDENYRKNMLENKKYIEDKYKIKLEFGNIIYYGDFYIWNNEKFIYIESYEKNNVIFLIISREITQYINDSIKYFESINNTETIKMMKNIGKELKLSKIELSLNDKYLSILDFDVNELVGIHFNYVYKNTNGLIEIEINYMNIKGEIDKKFPSYCFQTENLEISFLKLVDFQYKLSMHQFEFVCKLEAEPEIEIKPKWTNTILVKNKKVIIGNIEENIKSSYECIVYCNMYEKFKNEEIIQNLLIEEFDYNELLLINSKKEFLIMKDFNDFDSFITNNRIF